MAHIMCRVCGEELTGVGTPPVSCLSCDTPYHIDCWSYNGSRCGVYGCSGQRAVAGLGPGVGRSAPPPLPARFVWRRPSVELEQAALWMLAVPAVTCAAALGQGLILMPLAAACLLWWATDRFLWLSAVEVDSAGLCFRYWLHPPKRVSWGEVVRGPGAGDWTGALELADGTILVLPRGAPGFDEVLQRTAVALATLRVSADVFYIGEEA